MISIVGWSPICPTYIAELISTSTGHVIAALIFLDDKLAFFALSVVQVTLEKFYLLIITLSFMNCKKTLTTEWLFALITNNHILDSCFDYALTVFFGT